MTTLAIPSIHLNGTSRKSLLDGYRNALYALREAETALQETGPNGRDYYVQPAGAFALAQEQHVARCRALRNVITELEQVAEQIAE